LVFMNWPTFFSPSLFFPCHRRRCNTMAAPAGSSSSRPTASTNSSSLVIPQTAPAGGLLITQPPQTATSFFKIAPSQPITFGWNITSLIVTPTHLTVSAVCENGNTYPVGPTDGIIPGTATQVVWDLYSYQQANPSKPLAQAGYTLSVWGDQGPTAVRRPGYLQPNSGLRFALYTPEAYTPLASWTCAACTSAASLAAHPASISLLVTLFLMVFSGFYLIRRSLRSIQV